MQYMKAMNDKAPGNVKLLIHLGIERLGQGQGKKDVKSENDDFNFYKHHYMNSQGKDVSTSENQPEAMQELCGSDPSL